MLTSALQACLGHPVSCSHTGELWECVPYPCPETSSHRPGLGSEQKGFFSCCQWHCSNRRVCSAVISGLGAEGVPPELRFVANKWKMLVLGKKSCAVDQPNFAWLRALLLNLLCGGAAGLQEQQTWQWLQWVTLHENKWNPRALWGWSRALGLVLPWWKASEKR